MMSINLRINVDGSIATIYSDEKREIFENILDINKFICQRATYVEMNSNSCRWEIQVPGTGILPKTFKKRSEALEYEEQWLTKNILQNPNINITKLGRIS